MPSDEALKAAREWHEFGRRVHCTDKQPCRWCLKLAAAFDAYHQERLKELRVWSAQYAGWVPLMDEPLCKEEDLDASE
jgi:hypothetical protein